MCFWGDFLYSCLWCAVVRCGTCDISSIVLGEVLGSLSLRVRSLVSAGGDLGTYLGSDLAGDFRHW